MNVDAEPPSTAPTDERQHATHDAAWQARPAGAAGGSVPTVSSRAVLRLQRLAGNAGVGSLVDQRGRGRARRRCSTSSARAAARRCRRPCAPTWSRSSAPTSATSASTTAAPPPTSAQAVKAKAYTVGNEVVFNQGAYQPDTPAGRHTLAHELTHVVQQRSGPGRRHADRRRRRRQRPRRPLRAGGRVPCHRSEHATAGRGGRGGARGARRPPRRGDGGRGGARARRVTSVDSVLRDARLSGEI